MKKGFTLIELLAVIVILAIIALIAVPAVLNIIEDSRLSTTKVELYDRLKETTDLKNQYLKEYDTENADNIDMFHINIAVMQRVVSELEEKRIPLIEGIETQDTDPVE